MKPVALLTDFGLDDHYVGVLHAVLAAESPGVERIDLSHAVPAGDVWTGCYFLRCAWPHLPANAVVLAVVDPGVGTGRRIAAAQLRGRWLVGPDNGLLTALGIPGRCLVLDAEAMGLEHVSSTFHGRDILAPAAARLARGDDPGALGTEADSETLVPCPIPEPEREGRRIRGVVLHVDRFGNLVTNVPWPWLVDGAELRAGWRRVGRRVRTYGDGREGEAVLLEGSSGLLEVAVNAGSAAELLDLERGETVEVRLPDGGESERKRTPGRRGAKTPSEGV